MSYTCKVCKFGLERSPDGHKPPQGTVFCSKRKLAIAAGRSLSCFVPLVAERSKRCQDCKWARRIKPTGGAPELGKMWCEKRHFETNKLMKQDCFE